MPSFTMAAAVTTTFNYNKPSCSQNPCNIEGYMWFAMVAAVCCPFAAFCCCCICNKWYLTSGPYAGLTDQQVCPPGQRCTRPCRICCVWCCNHLLVPIPGVQSPTDDVTNSGQDNATTTSNFDRPPPLYEEALTMSRPKDGTVVIFVTGCGEGVCSFKFSKSHCDPPAYSFPGGDVVLEMEQGSSRE